MKKSQLQDWLDMRYVGAFDSDQQTGLAAYTISVPGEWEYTQRIELVKADGAPAAIPGAGRVTAGGVREEMPRFSPDGTGLAFLSDAGGETQVWLCLLESGETRRVTSLPGGVEYFDWSPDGTQLAVVSPCSRARAQEAVEGREYRPVVTMGESYKHEGLPGLTRKPASHVYAVQVDSGTAVKLTDGDRHHVMPVWSPDGTRIAFVSNRCYPPEAGIAMDLFITDASGGGLTRLTDGAWLCCYPVPFQPVFTPDAAQIVYAALEMGKYPTFPPSRLFAVSARGGKPRPLWPQDAPCHEATAFLYNAENYGRFTHTARMSEDGKHLYFIGGWEGACGVYRANVTGKRRVVKVTDEKSSYRALGRPAGGKLVAAKGSPSSTPQLVTLDLATGLDTPLTDTNPWLRERPLSPMEELWIDTLDGRGRVHGFVMPPQEMPKPGEKCPFALYIHGGPAPFYGFALSYEHQILAAAGMAVVLCNPRGTSGYGVEYAEQSQAFDGTAMTDLLQFLNAAARKYPWMDSTRAGVTGGSYGGYMTNWLVTHTKRFRAAATQRGIANELISYASSDFPGSSKDYGDFQDFMKEMIRKSAVAYADAVDAPLLILHGMEDKRCPVEGAHQLFTAVKDCHPDLPVRLVLFPGANHNLTMDGPARHRMEHCREIRDWFLKYL